MNYRVVIPSRIANAIHTVAFLAEELGRDGAALRHAAEEIQLLLSDNPRDLGESRAGSERVLIVDPLTVVYEVFETAQVVFVYDAIYYPRQRL
jgi:hypothetical protein